jgi:tetraacyldisaccharide 4'-kinase
MHWDSGIEAMRDNFNHSIASWLLRNWYAPSSSHLPWILHDLLDLGVKLYRTGLLRHQRRVRLRRRRLPAFVISVGNLVVGGAGKTPLTLWLANHARTLGRNPAILSRGYKRTDASVARVTSSGQSRQEALRFGDEPVLMARRGAPVPVWVGKDRWRSGILAIQTDRADTLVLDDGFQHLALERDLDLVLIDAHAPFGNGSLLPLGPLREPPGHLDRADAIVLTRAEDPARTQETRTKITEWFPEKPVFSCIHRLIGLNVGIEGQPIPLAALHGRKAIAFAGIARPESFFQLLQKAGVIVSRHFAFPDHHAYLAADMMMLIGAMEESNAPFLITTEKDMVRLSPEFQAFTLATIVEIDFQLEHEAFCSFLRRTFSSR